jgi:hypothetical protein
VTRDKDKVVAVSEQNIMPSIDIYSSSGIALGSLTV